MKPHHGRHPSTRRRSSQWRVVPLLAVVALAVGGAAPPVGATAADVAAVRGHAVAPGVPGNDGAQPHDGTALPPGAMEAVSRALGRDDTAYHAVPKSTDPAAGVTLTNGVNHLNTSLGADGRVAVESPGARAEFGLSGWGYGDQLSAVPPVAGMGFRDNVVSYGHGSLTDWYVNGPAGLQHGVTIAAGPGTRGGGPLTLALALGGNLTPRVLRSADGITLTAASGATLNYDHLYVVDASGRQLPSWFEVHDQRTVYIRVDDSGARFPITVDPLIQQAKLTGAGGVPRSAFGSAVAVDGDTVAVGAPGTPGSPGAVYVFVKPPSGWLNATPVAVLTQPVSPDGGLGSSVAIDGDTIVAGAPDASLGATWSGALFVYTKPATGWADAQPVARLSTSDGTPFTALGRSVAVAGDTIVAGGDLSQSYVFVRTATGWADAPENGVLSVPGGGSGLGLSVAIDADTIVAGAPIDGAGAAYVFAKPPGGWADAAPVAKLSVPGAAATARVGESVALVGGTAVVGAPGTLPGGGSSADDTAGAVYVFTEAVNGWTNSAPAAVLRASDGSTTVRIGRSVALSGDTVVAGAASQGTDFEVYVFTRPATGWTDATETARLTPADLDEGSAGAAVAISGDTVIASDPSRGSPAAAGEESSDVGNGMVYAYVKPDGSWRNATETARLAAAAPPAQSNLGFSVAMSGDTIVAGAPGAGPEGQGAVFVFVKPATGWVSALETAELVSATAQPGAALGSSVAIDGDVIAAGAPGESNGAGAVYVFAKPSSGWASGSETARLVLPEPPPQTGFGHAVALSGDTLVAGAPGTGTVHVFQRPGDADWAAAAALATLSDPDGAGELGTAVAVSSSGDIVVAGAPGAKAGAGAVDVYLKPAAGWTDAAYSAKLTGEPGQNIGALGRSVAITGGGGTIAAGAPGLQGESAAPDRGGAVLLFAKPGSGWQSGTETAILSASDAASGDEFGAAVAVTDDSVAVGAPGAGGQGAVYLFARPAAGWADATETEKRLATGAGTGSSAGAAVAFDGVTLAVGTPRYSDLSAAQGAVFVFAVSAAPPPAPPPAPPSVPAGPPTAAPVAAFAATPGAVTFPELLPFAPPMIRDVVVVNTGQAAFGTPVLSIAAVAGHDPAEAAEFSIVADGCADATPLAPGRSCTIEVAFSPHGAGPRAAALVIRFGGEQASIGLAGEGTRQATLANPAICRSGCVVTVSGTGFPPGRPVDVTAGTSDVGRAVSRPLAGADGRFTVTFVVFPRGRIGSVALTARSAGTDVSAMANVLVAPGSAAPPDFIVRR